MRKSEFKEIVQDGINRGRAFMSVKIVSYIYKEVYLC